MESSRWRRGCGPGMRLWPVIAFTITLGLGACHDPEESTGPDADLAALVVVSPARVTHPFSLDTIRLSAEAFNAFGEPLTNVTFVWTSSDTAVAVVDATGLVATRRYGRVQVEARAGDAVGRAEVIVSPGTPLENECMRCHSASNPYRHVAWGFPPAACTACHVMNATPHSGKIDAHQTASGGFPLGGAHALATCTVCHEPGNGTVAASPENAQDCIACHRSDYEGFHPDGWPTSCWACHNTDTWSGATFDHESASGGFRLLGAHAALDCSSCHDPATFAPLWKPADDSDCVTCHQPLYDAQHGGTGYPTTCLTCHTRSRWSGATFDHESASGFALPTDHTDLVCTQCHDAVTFAPLYSPSSSTDCIACHQTLYDVQHAADAYPTACLTCHTTAAWVPANFDHDANWFPIFSGEHRNRWTDCATCHPNSAAFTEFTCFNCHRHNQTSMDNTHAGIGGYAYDSAACYGCHPSGEAP